MGADRERLARNLKVAREAKGVTQTAAAEAVEKSRGTIVNWERTNGEFEPSSDELEILSALYGVSSKALRFDYLERGAAVARTFNDVVSETGLQKEVAQPATEKRRAKRPAAKTPRKRAGGSS